MANHCHHGSVLCKRYRIHECAHDAQAKPAGWRTGKILLLLRRLLKSAARIPHLNVQRVAHEGASHSEGTSLPMPSMLDGILYGFACCHLDLGDLGGAEAAGTRKSRDRFTGDGDVPWITVVGSRIFGRQT